MKKVKLNVCSIWPLAQISDDFYFLDIWQCARYFVAALFKELALMTMMEMWGLESRLEISGLDLGFYVKVSVSSRSLSQVRSRSRTVAYVENFHGGFWVSIVWWSFVFGLRCLWRHNLTSFPRFQTNVLAKFVDIIMHIFLHPLPLFHVALHWI